MATFHGLGATACLQVLRTPWVERHSHRRRHRLRSEVTLVWRFPDPMIVFLFFPFVFAPSAFFNTLFHAWEVGHNVFKVW